MHIPSFVVSAEKLITDNAPTILTGVGVVGTVATAVLAGKASWTAHERLANLWVKKNQAALAAVDPEEARAGIEQTEPTVKEKALAILPLYIPAALVCGGTVTAIVFSHKISASRLAGMAAVYALSEGKLKDYKTKVEELMGVEKKNEVDVASAQDAANKAISTQKPQLFMIGVEEALIWDAYSGRYFKSTVDKIKAAQNEINAEVISSNYVKLHYFWDAIGLGQNAMSDIMGFNLDNLLDVEFTPHMNEMEMPYLIMEYTPVSLARSLHQR